MSFPSPILSLYFCIKSSAPEKATCVIYFFTSSSVIPIPLSLKVNVPSSLFTETTTLNFSSSIPSASPRDTSLLYLLTASHPLLISSLMKISLSEYNHFLIIGNIFSVWIEILPFSILIFIPP